MESWTLCGFEKTMVDGDGIWTMEPIAGCHWRLEELRSQEDQNAGQRRRTSREEVEAEESLGEGTARLSLPGYSGSRHQALTKMKPLPNPGPGRWISTAKPHPCAHHVGRRGLNLMRAEEQPTVR